MGHFSKREKFLMVVLWASFVFWYTVLMMGVCGMKDLLLIYIFTGAAFIGCAIYLEVKADKYRVKVPVIAPLLFGAGLAMLISVVAVLLI